MHSPKPACKATTQPLSSSSSHNDQSSRPEHWTEETTEFPANLKRFVEEVHAAGATPVLVTPLTRREFKDGKLQNTLASW